MSIRSILVNVDLNVVDSTALQCAIDLAGKLDAELIGLAAEEPGMGTVGLDGGAAAADLYLFERRELEKRLEVAEQQFRALIPDGMKAQWRAYVANPIRCLIDTSCTADLIVTGSTTSAALHERQKVDLGELVVASGRPVLDVADGATKIATDNIVIGWKNTREARRAVADAMPFLTRAKHIIAITISEGEAAIERRNLDDLLGWLARHDIRASGEVIPNKEGFVDLLESTALVHQANILVAGGYGHSRMSEWLFGGVTRNLLTDNRLTRLFSN